MHQAEFVPGQTVPLFELKPPVFEGIDFVVKRSFDVVVAALLVLSLARPEALGMGDVKLALLLVLGLDGRGVVALVLALALAAGFGCLLLLRFGGAARSRKLPLAPFFAAGALIALLA